MSKHFVIDRFDYVKLKRDDVEFSVLYDEYSETLDEIIIKTTAMIPELRRGWLGDLTYATCKGYSIETGNEEECIFKCCYHDVLLIRVEAAYEPNEAVRWTYTFLKA